MRRPKRVATRVCEGCARTQVHVRATHVESAALRRKKNESLDLQSVRLHEAGDREKLRKSLYARTLHSDKT